MEKTQWYKDKVFYQIWPRSFKNGNGDGMGDLLGVCEVRLEGYFFCRKRVRVLLFSSRVRCVYFGGGYFHHRKEKIYYICMKVLLTPSEFENNYQITASLMDVNMENFYDEYLRLYKLIK